jgi:hypothetical protein
VSERGWDEEAKSVVESRSRLSAQKEKATHEEWLSGIWWASRESNTAPKGYEPAALTEHELEALGGSGEIRTHGTLRFAGFQDRCIQPLCHTSAGASEGVRTLVISLEGFCSAIEIRPQSRPDSDTNLRMVASPENPDHF